MMEFLSEFVSVCIVLSIERDHENWKIGIVSNNIWFLFFLSREARF